MIDIKQTLKYLYEFGNINDTANYLKITRQSVGKINKFATQNNIKYDDIKDLSKIEVNKLFEKKYQTGDVENFYKINLEEFSSILSSKKGSRLKAYNKYLENARENNKKSYSRSQFYRVLDEEFLDSKVSMKFSHLPGRECQSDWSGKKFFIFDDNKNSLEIHLFVCSCVYSSYMYVEGFLNEKIENWLLGHIHAFESFQGVPRFVICDNLLAGVSKSDRYEPEINEKFQNMLNYYKTTACPARVAKPKDKPTVERSVGIAYSIVETLDIENIHSITDFNSSLFDAVTLFNNRPMSNGRGSRSEYLIKDQSLFRPLPAKPYDIPTNIKYLKVQKDYHVHFMKMFYSVPYKLIGKIVYCEQIGDTLRISLDNQIVAEHTILSGEPGQFVTLDEHKYPGHKHYTPDLKTTNEILDTAEDIGENASILIKKVLKSDPIEGKSFKLCSSILGLSKQFDSKLFNEACNKILNNNIKISYYKLRSILNELVLQKKQSADSITNDKSESQDKDQSSSKIDNLKGAITRGNRFK
jgi:hypothetical protein